MIIEGYDAIRDVSMRHEVMGIDLMYSPYGRFVTAQRQNMVGSNLPQAVVINGAEQPFSFTGWESALKDYAFNESVLPDNAIIIATIPKFKIHHGSYQINANPSTLIIFENERTGKVDYVMQSTYTKVYEKFGFLNKMVNQRRIREGDFYSKGECFNKPPNHIGDNMHGYGVNCNVAFMTLPETVEDAFIVSDEMARKFDSYSICTKRINIKPSDLPINLYGGDDTEFKLFPDVGEVVGDHGILMGLRPSTPDTVLVDSSLELLSDFDPLNDNLYKVLPGSEILDIEIHCNKPILRQIEGDRLYSQMYKYLKHRNDYYDAIIKTYEKITADGLKCSSKFNNLVTEAYKLTHTSHKRIKSNPKVVDGRVPIPFISITVTYGHEVKCGVGFKCTGRDGAKGVFSTVWPKANMPKDENGVVADIVLSSESPFNRLNSSQWYEQFDGRGVALMQQRFQRGYYGPPEQAFEVLAEFCGDIRAQLKEEMYRLRDLVGVHKLMKAVCEVGILLHIKPFCVDITLDSKKAICDKWDLHPTPVTYTRDYGDGDPRTFTTKKPVLIGSKYCMLLGKIPLHQLSSIGIGYENQFGLASKSDNAKYFSNIGQTPMRNGEDEGANQIMTVGTEPVVRQQALNGNSKVGVDLLGHTLLTHPQPSNIDHVDISTGELLDTCINIGILNQIFGTSGYDLTNGSIYNDVQRTQ